MIQSVRVYADGRLCIPREVLDQFRKKSKGAKQAVWVSLFDNGKRNPEILLTWNECSGTAVKSSKKYDLSVRDRVLFKAPEGVKRFKAGERFNFHVNGMAVHVALVKFELDKPKPVVKKPAKRKAGRPSKQTQLEKQFDAQFRVKLCEILAEPRFADITIEELAKTMPDLTIREIVSA